MANGETLIKYKALLEDAARLEEMAGEKSGGPTFWDDMRRCTGAAISCELQVPTPGTTWSMSHAQMFAIWQVCSPHLVALWKDAAAEVRAAAQRMLTELEQERVELNETIAALKNP